jgi:hypothetical protein
MCKTLSFIALIILLLGSSALAQAKRKPRVAPKQKPVPVETTTTEIKTETPAVSAPAKKNERTENAQMQMPDATAPQKKNNNRGENAVNNSPAATPFAYEFSQPQFVISKVVIEHDANGKGKITFEKQNVGEPVSDPLEISAKSLENIKRLWTELNFLDSTEDYQSTKYKYPHLGVMKLRQEQNSKKREATFDWTENKLAKDLTDEYKKLTEQFIWLFEMNLARENQPLSAPQLVDRFESLLRRNQISDPQQMLPYLREVSDDERLPLIARNHTAKLIKNIEKQKEK